MASKKSKHAKHCLRVNLQKNHQDKFETYQSKSSLFSQQEQIKLLAGVLEKK